MQYPCKIDLVMTPAVLISKGQHIYLLWASSGCEFAHDSMALKRAHYSQRDYDEGVSAVTDALGHNIVDLDNSPRVILSTLTIFMLLRDGVEQSNHSVTMAQHMQLPLSDDYP